MHRIAVVHDLGSAGVLDIVAALDGFADAVFVCPESQHIRQPTELVDEVAVLCDIAGLDLDEAAERLRAHKPEGILTFSEYQLERTAQLAARLDLPFHPVHRIEALTRKHVQRELLNTHGVSAVPTRLVRDEPSARQALDTIGVPAVLKPDQGAGSRSTYRIAHPDDLKRACAELFPPSTAQRAGESFVLERQIASASLEWPWGDYVSVESAVFDEEIAHLAVTGKFPLAEPFRETGSFLPAQLPSAVQDQVLDVASGAIRALGVERGLCHTEIKFSPRGPEVIEVNGRLGGRIHELLHTAKGINAIELAVRIALGDATALHAVDTSAHRSIAFLYAKVPQPGATRLLEVRGAGELQRRAGISRVLVHQEAGDRLDWRNGRLGNTYVCYGSAPTHEELADLIADIEETMQVTYEWTGRPHDQTDHQ